MIGLRLLKNFIFERFAVGIVFREPCFRGLSTCKNFEMIDVANFFVGVDINPDGHWSLLSFRFSECVTCDNSFWYRLIARIMAIPHRVDRRDRFLTDRYRLAVATPEKIS
jgi:hypothetical protein